MVSYHSLKCAKRQHTSTLSKTWQSLNTVYNTSHDISHYKLNAEIKFIFALKKFLNISSAYIFRFKFKEGATQECSFPKLFSRLFFLTSPFCFPDPTLFYPLYLTSPTNFTHNIPHSKSLSPLIK